MMRYICLLLILWVQDAVGQVLSTAPLWSFGIHFNPAFTTPLMAGNSQYDARLHPIPAALGYNTGVNLHYKLPEMTFETGINYIKKSFTIRQRLYHFENLSGFDDTRNNHFSITSSSSSFEIPLQVSYCLHHHDKRMVYDLHAVAGASGELNWVTGYTERTIGNAGSIVNTDYTLPGANTKKLWINVIAGFKVHAILRIMGLIDYGLIWHIPVQTNGPYKIVSVVKDYTNGGVITYNGNYKPHLGYLDAKFCYYFLNFDKNRRHLKYRSKRDDDDKNRKK